MFAFLKSPPAAPPITDKPALDARYRYWRRHILLTIWLGYALFYFTRKSFNAAVPENLASNVLTRSDIGLLGFDELEWAELAGVGITTLKQPTWQIGFAAVEQVVRRIEGSNDPVCERVFSGELIVRGSTSR